MYHYIAKNKNFLEIKSLSSFVENELFIKPIIMEKNGFYTLVAFDLKKEEIALCTKYEEEGIKTPYACYCVVWGSFDGKTFYKSEFFNSKEEAKAVFDYLSTNSSISQKMIISSLESDKIKNIVNKAQLVKTPIRTMSYDEIAALLQENGENENEC